MIDESVYNKAAAFSVIFIVSILFSPIVEAGLECRMGPQDMPGDVKVLGMSSASNAHAEIPSQNNYADSYDITCRVPGMDILSTACTGGDDSAEVLYLSSVTNAHVGNPMVSSYTEKVCLSTTNGDDVFCRVTASGCNSDEECVVSISADTNAHVGECGTYSRDVCCEVRVCEQANPTVTLDPSPPESKEGNPGEERSYDVTVTNEDNQYCSGPKVFTLSSDCPSGWTCTFDDPSLSINPLASDPTTIRVTPDSGATEGNYLFDVTATSGSFQGTGQGRYDIGCTPEDPLVELVPATGQGEPGDAVDFEVRVTSQDSAGCAARDFTVSSTTCPDGWTCSVTSGSSLSISPSETKTATLEVTSSLTDLAGTYPVAAQASAGGNSAEGTADYEILCVRSNPAVSVTSPVDPEGQTDNPGDTIDYTVQVTNNNGLGCGAESFDVSVDVPTGWSAESSPVSISPGGGSGVVVLGVTSSSSADEGVYELTAKAELSTDPSNAGSDTTNYIVEPFPVAWVTNPPDDTTIGKIFTITWDGSEEAEEYQFQIVDRAIFDGPEDWPTPPIMKGSEKSHEVDVSGAGEINPTYCYRVRGINDEAEEGDWSCDPANRVDMIEECNCTTLDTGAPRQADSSIETRPSYTNETPDVEFDLAWTGSDDDSGIQCYMIEYRITNEKDETEIQAWSDWSVPVLSGAANDHTTSVFVEGSGTCVDMECVTSTEAVVSTAPADDDRTYSFRVKAIDNAYGCSNVQASWKNSIPGTGIDWEAPLNTMINVLAEGPSGVLADGEQVFTEEAVTLSVDSDPAGEDYSGVNSTGIYYQRRVPSTTGNFVDPVPVRLPCPGPGETSSCLNLGPLSWDDDYDVDYWGYAGDRSGNLGTGDTMTFKVRKPIKILSQISDFYLILGSYEYVPLLIDNRQDVEENLTLTLADYDYAYFSAEGSGITISDDRKEMNVTMTDHETIPFKVMLMTAYRCDDCKVTIGAMSTLEGHEDITDTLEIGIKVDYPPEFSGLSWEAVLAVMIAASILYIIVSRKS